MNPKIENLTEPYPKIDDVSIIRCSSGIRLRIEEEEETLEGIGNWEKMGQYRDMDEKGRILLVIEWSTHTRTEIIHRHQVIRRGKEDEDDELISDTFEREPLNSGGAKNYGGNFGSIRIDE